MNNTRTPLLAVLGPVLGVIVLIWVINLGLNQVRATQEEIKLNARQENLAAAEQPAEVITSPQAAGDTATLTAAESITTAIEVLPVDTVTQALDILPVTGVTATQFLTSDQDIEAGAFVADAVTNTATNTVTSTVTGTVSITDSTAVTAAVPLSETEPVTTTP